MLKIYFLKSENSVAFVIFVKMVGSGKTMGNFENFDSLNVVKNVKIYRNSLYKVQIS